MSLRLSIEANPHHYHGEVRSKDTSLDKLSPERRRLVRLGVLRSPNSDLYYQLIERDKKIQRKIHSPIA